MDKRNEAPTSTSSAPHQDAQRVKCILRKLFNEIDTDHSGFIEYDELQAVMADRGFSRKELDGAWLSLLAVDENRDSRVSFPEFQRAFQPLVERQLKHTSWWHFWNKKNPPCDLSSMEDMVTMDNLLSEWQRLAETLSIGNDISMYIPPPQNQQAISMWNLALAGMASGSLGRLVTAPLEKASLMQQVSGHNFRTEFRRALALAQEEGYIKALWTGAGWNAFRVAIFSAVSTVGTAQLYSLFPVPAFQDETEEAVYDWREPAYRGMLGAVSGLVATVVTHPLDVIRTRVTLNDVHPSLRGSEALAESENALETVRAITDTGGTRAFWRGLAPAVLGVVPFCGAHHCLFDLFKHLTKEFFDSRGQTTTVPVIIGCGVAAGMGAQTLVYPLEVIRRRQIEVGSGGTKLNYSMKSATRAILRDAGIPGLFAGLIPAYLRVAPAVVISLLIRHHTVARLDRK
eukprot:scaffold244_cov172-Amphora_coffeaeformis.AAC.22